MLFRNPDTGANYMTTDASARRTTIPGGAKLRFNAGAVLEVNHPPLMDAGYEQNSFSVTLDYTAETPPNTGNPTSFADVDGTRKIWHHDITFTHSFNRTPVCFLTPVSANADASRIKTWVVSSNAATVTFAISIDGPVGTTSFEWTAIGFDSS
jgi:hypothetical protein